jgi:hypothetical protein
MVDTIGSRFDTVLAIYRDTNFIVLSSNPGAALVACDNNSAPDGIRSRLQYNTKAGVVYLAVVDGVQSAKGLATINWQLANAPIIVGGMSNLVGTFRTNLTLSSGTMSTAVKTSYQWLFNGNAIVGATNSTLTLTNLQLGQAGYYSVIASNYAGSVYNTPAQVSINVPLQMDSTLQFINGQVHGAIWGNINDTCVLEASTDLRHWIPINFVSIQAQPQPFLDLDAEFYDQVFYRVRPYSGNP